MRLSLWFRRAWNVFCPPDRCLGLGRNIHAVISSRRRPSTAGVPTHRAALTSSLDPIVLCVLRADRRGAGLQLGRLGIVAGLAQQGGAVFEACGKAEMIRVDGLLDDRQGPIEERLRSAGRAVPRAPRIREGSNPGRTSLMGHLTARMAGPSVSWRFFLAAGGAGNGP